MNRYRVVKVTTTGFGPNATSTTEVEDPRHKVRDSRQAALEAAIDAENRRRFPGDYIDDDDDPELGDDWSR